MSFADDTVLLVKGEPGKKPFNMLRYSRDRRHLDLPNLVIPGIKWPQLKDLFLARFDIVETPAAIYGD